MCVTKRFLAGCLFALIFAPPGLAGIGELDSGFGNQGVLALPGNSGPSVIEMLDGRLLVVGVVSGQNTTRKVVLHRLQETGAPDPSFGAGKGVLVDWLGWEPGHVSEALQQADGKIVIAGGTSTGAPLIARLDSQGSLDTGFASAGAWAGFGTEPFYSSLLQTSDGQLIGSISDWTDDRIDWFSSDGHYLGNLNPGIAPERMAAQSDGRLVVTGYDRTMKRAVLMRLGQDGSVDRSFGQDGYAPVGAGFVDFMSIEPGGDRILLCGSGIQRLTADGRPDISFGAAGTSVVDFGRSGIPAFRYCQGILALQGGGAVYLGIRGASLPGGEDQALIGGVTSLGLVDKRFGSGSGASVIPLGLGKLPTGLFFDLDIRLVRLRSGNALLSLNAGSGLWLARIDLGGEAASPANVFTVLKRAAATSPAITWPTPGPQPPASPVSSVPSIALPTAAPTASTTGGGGALGALELLLAAAALDARRRRCRPRHPA